MKRMFGRSAAVAKRTNRIKQTTMKREMKFAPHVILRLETNDDRLCGSEYEHSWLRLISVERLRLAGRAGRPARHTARRDAEQRTRDACAPRTIVFISSAAKNPVTRPHPHTLLDSSLRSE